MQFHCIEELPPRMVPAHGMHGFIAKFEILAAQKTALPKSATGKAASYTLALWSRITLFLEHP
jgi:hypothetical protein